VSFDESDVLDLKSLDDIRIEVISLCLQVEGFGILKRNLTSDTGEIVEIYVEGALYGLGLPTQLLAL